jgi:hypothetical protein
MSRLVAALIDFAATKDRLDVVRAGRARLPRTPEHIRGEVAALIAARSPQARASAEGRLWALEAPSDDDARHSPHAWILRAHIRILDRLDRLFVAPSEPGTFELLALTRHLFESLVWARLFNRDSGYGLVFYRRLIADQITAQDQVIEKLEAEIKVFEDFDKLEKAANDETVIAALSKEAPDLTEVESAQAEFHRRQAALDADVRRGFALYGDDAQRQGFGFQAHLVREKALPQHVARRDEWAAHLTAVDTVLSSLLSAECLSRATARGWNWKDSATLVGMKAQYEYLYSLTSRLLHATPLNITTDHDLSEGERGILHEYVFVAVGDMLDEIDSFRFDGQSDIVVINIEE